jgi:DNA-binding protein
LVILTALFTFAIQSYWHRKKEHLRKEAAEKIPQDIKQQIGEIRGKQPVVVQIEHPTVYIGPEIKTSISIIKKEKRIESLLPSKRKLELGEVEFSILRDAVGREFKEIDWLENNFKRALSSTLAFLGSGVKIDYKELLPGIKDYAKDIQILFDKNRLNHLIIPEIRRIHQMEIDKEEKWSAFKQYFDEVKKGLQGNMLWIGKKETNVYVEALEKEYVDVRKSPLVVIEAKGFDIHRAIVTIKEFMKRNLGWAIKRVDFSMYEYESEKTRRRAILWIEIINMGKEDAYNLNEIRRNFLKEILSVNKTITLLKDECHHPEKRHKICQIAGKALEDTGWVILTGSDEPVEGRPYLDDIISMAAIFRYHNWEYDYLVLLDFEDERSVLYFIFSKESIVERFESFIESKR